ncbi:MAG: GGDEF domain-containing protein [Sulfurimonadaceae bacterium]|nr:GGDEF domain-containing protein [Sulfurimonadaceae bacterium]
MDKHTLKSLITEMYENLILKIDEQDKPTKEQVIEFLYSTASALSSMSNSNIEKLSAKKFVFADLYKSIANESLLSYENTNLEFNKISQMHQETLEEYQLNHIDLPKITEKFNEIQKHMIEEVHKANETILTLTKQVRILEEKTNIDPLTKVFNRRALSHFLETICSNEHTHFDMHLLILDLDDFKNVNDTYGHVAGDKILIFLANMLKKTLREGDKIFRYGGEEFVIILNRIDDLTCEKIARRLLDLVESNNLIYKGQNLRVTMSMGGTRYRSDDTPDSLISRADAALYKAKSSGKNQLYTE